MCDARIECSKLKQMFCRHNISFPGVKFISGEIVMLLLLLFPRFLCVSLPEAHFLILFLSLSWVPSSDLLIVFVFFYDVTISLCLLSSKNFPLHTVLA